MGQISIRTLFWQIRFGTFISGNFKIWDSIAWILLYPTNALEQLNLYHISVINLTRNILLICKNTSPSNYMCLHLRFSRNFNLEQSLQYIYKGKSNTGAMYLSLLVLSKLFKLSQLTTFFIHWINQANQYFKV